MDISSLLRLMTLVLPINKGVNVSKKKFSVIVADCPWSFKDSLKMSDVKRGAQANYQTMTMQEIRSLPVNAHCDPKGAVLCLWVPGSLLQEGLDTMKAWGFKHKQTYVWVKTKKEPLDFFKKAILATRKQSEVVYDKYAYMRIIKSIADACLPVGKDLFKSLAFGMGRLFRQTHEICLIGTYGQINLQLANRSQRSVSFAENLKHSAKPEHLQDSLEIMFPKARKLELFARRLRPDWTCLGNEIDGKDIHDALADL
jgi:N6-adenosine-specific RNA methylase IME4